MTENGKKKVMRQAAQVRPLIVSASRSRVTQEVSMSASTSRDLMAYARWAAKEAGMTTEEAVILTVDRAVGDLLRKDDAWQKARARVGVPAERGEGSPNPAPAPSSAGANPVPARQS
jgi:hypothetical protein